MVAALLTPKFLIGLAAYLLQSSLVVADNNFILPPHAPQICDGLHRENGKLVVSNPYHDNCRANSAIVKALRTGVHRRAKPEAIPLFGGCCELPASDILTTEQKLSSDSCPNGFVATGKRDSVCESCPYQMVCTKINKQRYMLGPETVGAFVGHSANYWREKKKFLASDLPAAFRHSVARMGFYFWGTSECVGYPFGSLLTSKKGKRCHQFGFRQLQYRGLLGDPPVGTPVQMFPDCIVVTGYHNGESVCVR